MFWRSKHLSKTLDYCVSGFQVRLKHQCFASRMLREQPCSDLKCTGSESFKWHCSGKRREHRLSHPGSAFIMGAAPWLESETLQYPFRCLGRLLNEAPLTHFHVSNLFNFRAVEGSIALCCLNRFQKVPLPKVKRCTDQAWSAHIGCISDARSPWTNAKSMSCKLLYSPGAKKGVDLP